jgi:hypothetical protein
MSFQNYFICNIYKEASTELHSLSSEHALRAAVVWRARELGMRGPDARADSGWLKVKEAGMDDVGEQATRACTGLHSLVARKSF